MDLGLQNKVALVLASSKGLGKAVAMELVREGAKVILCGRDARALDTTRAEMEVFAPGHVASFVCDLTNEVQRKKLVSQSVDAFGTIEILVTNSGGPPAGGFEKFDTEDWKQAFNLLVLGVVDMIHQVLPAMKAKGFGRILTITSITTRQPVDNLMLSNAVRTSLVGMAKSLSNEVAQHGITVNNLLPGFTSTDRLEQLMENNPQAGLVKESIPMKRFGTPAEFAAAAAFLVSERASYITGQSLAVDGGWIRGY